MNPPVEAQSISALCNLFANPPQYPRNPTHDVREPLVLYIVRVPGSKDVFLTPLKPPTKSSVSLEAIQSSLYYLHVVRREDEEVRRLIDQHRQSEEAERVRPPVSRKPLPPAPFANYPPSERPLPPSKAYPFYQPGLDGDTNATQQERYAARGTHLNFSSEQVTTGQHAKRHSLSPQRFQQISEPGYERQPYVTGATNTSTDSFGSQSSSFRQLHNTNIREGFRSQQSPFNESISFNASSPDYAVDQRSPQRSPTEPRDDLWVGNLRQATSITLIRRDPVSGSQWNVGSISITEHGASHLPLDPITIEITTPGYNRFLSQPDILRPGTAYSDAESIKEALATGRLSGPELVDHDVDRHCFVRVAEYQQQSMSNITSRLHRRPNSPEWSPKPASPTKQTRQVYSFTSPWHGLCTFSNGIDGRSLRCRHSLPASMSTASGQTLEDTTVTAAEIRFNLPVAGKTNATHRIPEDDKLPISKLIEPRSGKAAIRRGIQHIKSLSSDRTSNELYSSNWDHSALRERPTQNTLESDMDRLSLKLGREKAGGGFKGTSAKLGKLIVEDEGLKMCDLVVAACMGVWWQHYDGKDE